MAFIALIKYDRFIGNFYYFLYVASGAWWRRLDRINCTQHHFTLDWPLSTFKVLSFLLKLGMREELWRTGILFPSLWRDTGLSRGCLERLGQWRSPLAVIMLRQHCFTPIVPFISPTVSQFSCCDALSFRLTCGVFCKSFSLRSCLLQWRLWKWSDSQAHSHGCFVTPYARMNEFHLCSNFPNVIFWISL